jgi:hypothetical protein
MIGNVADRWIRHTIPLKSDLTYRHDVGNVVAWRPAFLAVRLVAGLSEREQLCGTARGQVSKPGHRGRIPTLGSESQCTTIHRRIRFGLWVTGGQPIITV